MKIQIVYDITVCILFAIGIAFTAALGRKSKKRQWYIGTIICIVPAMVCFFDAAVQTMFRQNLGELVVNLSKR